jgi:hypothetical protein
MPTAPSAWRERIAALDPVVAAQATVTGIGSDYTADAIVRRYLDRTLGDWQADTGDASDRIEIVAGIGTLVLDAAGAHFTPCGPFASPAPLPAPPDLVADRTTACRACDRYQGDRCTAAGCACAGLGQPDRLHSRCPLGRWAENPTH